MLENDLETACLSWLSDLGYTCLTGDDVSVGGDHEARQKYLEVVLAPRLRESLDRLNPSLPSSAVEEAFNKLTTYGAQSLAEGNREIYGWLRNGVPVEVEDSDAHKSTVLATVLDLENEGNNDFLAVQQFTVHGEKVRRPDIVLFVNGIPLAVLELKNPADINADIESAFNQIQTYKNDISQLFTYNLLNVVSDGTVARYGSLTAEYGHYSPWRLIDDEKAPEGMLELEVLVRGLLAPKTLLRFFKGFVLFMSQDGAPSIKIIAQWHQYHGVLKAVSRALDAYLHKKDGKGGVIWFTQGSGKSLLSVFYVMAIREIADFANPTFVIVTDRNDLDGQLYGTFSACEKSLRATPQQATDRDDLEEKLSTVQAGGIFFTTINKFAPKKGEKSVRRLCERENVIVITDEAHRTQYGFKAKLDEQTGETKYGLAKYMRDSLPNAIYLGMTGTPVSLDDRDTQSVFGTYVDVYDMIAAQKDNAVVPVHYESRIIELQFNEAEKQALMDEFIEATEEDDTDSQNRTVSRLTRLEALAMADGRLERLSGDLVNHWETRKESMPGKAMIVAISREAAVRLFDEIVKLRPDWKGDDLNAGKIKVVMTGNNASDPPHFQPHQTDKADRKLLEKRFKSASDELEMVIVRDMWLTGFDAPPVHTLYVDKPMQGHGLMQAIARTNRIWKDKPGGLVVDYIGIGEELKKAIKSYTRDSGTDKPPVDVSGEALAILLDTLDVIRKEFFHGFDYSQFSNPQQALALLGPAMEHITKLRPDPDEKGRNQGIHEYLDQVAKLTKAQALAGTRSEALALRDEIAFFQAVRVSLIKLTRVGSGKSRVEKEAALRQLVAKGVLVEGVQDLFGTLGLEKPDISVLDESFLKQISEMPTKNLAAELLQRLIEDEVKARSRRNVVQAKEFTDKLEEAINKYRNRGLTTAQVIEELIQLAKEISAARPPEGMGEDEFAFYQALCENESAVRELGDPILRALAHELTDKMRKSATIDWQKRQSARARMRMLIKVLLTKYRYPPDKQPAAVEKVIEQAELFADEWGIEHPSVA
ncbi:MAG: type I restriction endonuclease subunit R [Candidatus Thiodiazotropha endolucinida]|nr:type I restriction endonuclease subunit R [Candidatus Thiodiazotropha taylori]MCW4249205.1 type I restriction endonuclease subunit R [Candidatus Thiodiazotropha endolucinida]